MENNLVLPQKATYEDLSDPFVIELTPGCAGLYIRSAALG